MSEISPTLYTAPNKDVFEIGLFNSSDAEGVVELFLSVYGERYPVKIFYDPHALTDANLSGQIVTTVARNSEGGVVGVHNLFRSAPYERIYEWGAGLVLKAYRNLGLSNANGHFSMHRVVPLRDDIEEIYGEAVCYHVALQKAMLVFSAVETALEVALMPGEAYEMESFAGKRVATLFGSMNCRKRPQAIYVPQVYEAQLKYIYEDYPDKRYMKHCEENVPAYAKTSSDMAIFDFANVSRLAFHDIGQDFETELDRLEAQALEGNSVIIQAWLKLTTPWLDFAVKILRGRGYFLGGVLPRWFNDDGLLLQKILVDPEFETIQLYNQKARHILEMVREDWAAVGMRQ
jgi:hypothetical protein